MTREEFLKISGLVGLGSISYPWPSIGKPPVQKESILVIGAGIAGIAGAKTLQSAGYQVTVLEARDRIGGRIYTNDTLGLPIDMGASWIHGHKGNPIMDLVSQYNLPYRDSNFDNVKLYDFDGRVVSDEEAEEIAENSSWVLNKAARWANRQDQDVSLGAGINTIVKSEGLDRYPKEMRGMNWYISSQEMDDGTNYEKLSTWYGSDDGFGGEDRLFPNGYGQIVQKLATGLTIRLAHQVSHISYGESKVLVTTNQGEFEADRVILTVPLGVLKKGSIQFDPPLPKIKRRAIQNQLGMGVLNKIAIQFERRFWPDQVDFLGYQSEVKGQFPIFLNWSYYTGQPYLLGFLVGDLAEAYEQKTDEEIMDELNQLFKTLFKNASPITGIIRSRWRSDPYAFGSYSYVPVGGGDDGAANLGTPLGRLYFAGEATHTRYNATVHGAYLSGIREAERIMNQ